MDKQQSDHIDNMIRKAAESVSPPFNEKAWEKMELLLDKEHKKRRPAMIWWWMLLLSLIFSGAGYYYFSYRQTGIKTNAPLVTTSGQNKNDNGNVAHPVHQPNNNIPAVPVKAVPVSVNIHSGPALSALTVTATTGTRLQNQKEADNALSGTPTGKQVPRRASGTTKPGFESVQKSTPFVRSQPVVITDNISNNNTVQIEPSIKQQAAAGDKNHSDTLRSALPPEQQKNIAATDTAAITQQVKNTVVLHKAKGVHGFYFIASVARNSTDVKGISFNNLGYVSGGGVGYQLNNRWRIQTGFYAGKKIYKAGPNDYHVKDGALTWVTLKAVEANCYIYDIPLSVRYDVIRKKKLNVYGVAGLSSFIMKKENYMYHYNDATGRYGFLDTTYKGNKNFFSVMNLSIGVEQQIANGLYIQAEPYIKMPLSGIGEGNIKLYNAGLQIGIRYQPTKNKAHK